MEKKGNRNLPASRGASTDSKKDGVSSKPWPRGGRRREPSGGSLLSGRPEPSRKPQPQRVKTIDKRPKPRGNYYGAASSRTETASLDEEQEAELGSVFLPGSKKQSLNYLLNFSYSPRETSHPDRAYGGGKGGIGNRIATKKHKYNKEHFLQANCQFVVNDSGDYKRYMNDPDALVDWNLIEQVNVQVSEFPSCPICLYPPSAGKMTRCGHVYCWSCILHYLSLSDKPTRKCPICYESVHIDNLKSVIAIPHSTHNVNDTITFKLMKRARGSLTAYPVESATKEENTLFNISEKGADEIYSKLLLADREDILNIIAREERELTNQLLDAGENNPEICFIEQALTLLKERFERITNCVKEKSDSLEEKLAEDFKDLKVDKSEGLVSDETSKTATKIFYFYQAADGQHIYLHAINARMLENTYGSLEFGPKTLTGRILEKEGGSMTEELRKKLRYLQHLPVTCQFEVAEIQLRQPIVNKETMDIFQDQVEIRRKKRQRRAKEEKRREKRIEAEENRKMGKYPEANLHLDSETQFPEFGFEARLRTESECTLPSERSSSPDSSMTGLNLYSGPSFAKMLATTKKTTPKWPDLGPATSSTSLIIKNVTGAQMRSTVKAPRKTDSDIESEDYEPVPVFKRSFGDAIAQALQKAEEVVDKEVVQGKKKKNKNKQKVLFATNMAYSSGN